jgi:hypothetical protein
MDCLEVQRMVIQQPGVLVLLVHSVTKEHNLSEPALDTLEIHTPQLLEAHTLATAVVKADRCEANELTVALSPRAVVKGGTLTVAVSPRAVVKAHTWEAHKLIVAGSPHALAKAQGTMLVLEL